MRLRLLPALLPALLLSNCGYIGDPLPPLANIPSRVNDLAANQRGSRIIARFTIPEKTTEAFPIPRPLTLDLRVGAAGQFEENEWASHARHIPAPDLNGPVATYEIPALEWVGTEVILGVRVTGGTGKQSGWSNFVVVPVVAALATPVLATPETTAEGVRLIWSAPGPDFRVLRKAADGEYTVVADTTSPEWTDASAEFGKRYSYVVQAVRKLGESRQAESELSAEVSVTPEDHFPPAVPSGLRADSAPASIELTWTRNTESDLAGYRVYRSAGGGTMEKVAEVPAAPTYSDRAVQRGVTYRYSITSIDRAGNESTPSPAMEVVW